MSLSIASRTGEPRIRSRIKIEYYASNLSKPDLSSPSGGPGNVPDEDLKAELAELEKSVQNNEPVDFDNLYRRIVLPLTEDADNLAAFLPHIFRVKNKVPYSLYDYPQFIEFFNREIPPRRGLFTGRQLGKSQALACDSLTTAITSSGYEHLYIAPLYEQTRKFSDNYVKVMLDLCLLRDLVFDPGKCKHDVLQKSLLNGSKLHFSYCFTSADRTRGYSVSSLSIDEGQDIQYDFLPIIGETMSASKWRTWCIAGTNKTLDNNLEKNRLESSQGEWVIPCEHCHKENICCVAEDLLNILGPDGLICAKCGKPIQTRKGHWLHKFPDRRWDFAGWHIPQPIMPMHCEDPRRWGELKAKQRDKSKAFFINEVLGEACDVGSKLIPIDSIRKASILPFRNRIDEAVNYRLKTDYIGVAVGVDWGGRGVDEDSFTAFTVVGLRHDAKIDLIFAQKAPPAVTDTDEIEYVIQLMSAFKADCVGHDFRGAGTVKDDMLLHRGLQSKFIHPWANEASTARYFAKIKKTPTGRRFISINRAAACQLIAHLMNNGKMFLPKWEEATPDNPFVNPFLDFNSWFENYVSRPDGSSLYNVMKSNSQPDDVAWSTVYAAYSLFRRKQMWPLYAKNLTENGVLVDESGAKGESDS